MEFLGQPAPPKQPLSPASATSVNPALPTMASKSTVPLKAAALPSQTLVSQESAPQESSVSPTSQSALACHGIPELGRLAIGQENLVAEIRSLSQRMDKHLNRTVTSCCADHDDITLRGVRATPRFDSDVLNGLGIALSSAIRESKIMECSHAKRGKKVRPAAVTSGAVFRTAMAACVGILDLVRQSKRPIHRRGAGIKMS